MNKDFEEEIYKKYTFFGTEEERSNPVLSCLCWGFECGKGWEKLLRDLFKEIQKLLNKFPKSFLHVHQIKSKFGELRFYYDCSEDVSDELFKITTRYEKRSRKTCEECGSRAKQFIKHGWVSTLCDRCIKKRSS